MSANGRQQIGCRASIFAVPGHKGESTTLGRPSSAVHLALFRRLIAVIDAEALTARLEDPTILLHEKKLSGLRPLVPLLELVM